MPEEQNIPEYDSVEELKKRLNLRSTPPPEHERSGFSAPFSREGVPQLTEEDVLRESNKPPVPPRFSFMYKLFIGSIVFFISALGIAGYFFFSGSNIFSLDNIELSLAGPVAIEGGKELTLQVAIANKNSVNLETTDFVVEYPAGSRDPLDTSKPITRTREFLDIVRPGQVIQKTIRVVLFGEENTEKTVKVRIEFQTPSSNATFTKEKTYSLALTSSPVGLTLALPDEIVSGDEVILDVGVGSNSDTAVKGVLLSLVYPPGFSFVSATPPPTFQNSVWAIGDLLSGGKRSIRIVGIQEGQNDEAKAFKASVGTQSEKAEDVIGTVYTSVFKTLSIQRPHLGAQFALNDSTDDVVVSAPGGRLKGVISYVNNLPERILNPSVTLKLNGAALDQSTVSPDQGGFYTSSENSVLWDKSGNKYLEVLEPGAAGEINFSFASLPAFSPDFPKGKNPDITLELTVRGTRLSPGQTSEEITTVIKRRVKLSSVAQLSSRLVYSLGPFKNTGPLPPKADEATTYTVIWSVTNLSSDISGVTVEATLPQYVEWAGTFSPSDEKISFVGGKALWTIGVLKAGTGVSTSAREVSFQISFKPSIAQAGFAPVLVSDAVLRATDDFTKAPLQSTQRALTTVLSTDPIYRDGQDKVVK